MKIFWFLFVGLLVTSCAGSATEDRGEASQGKTELTQAGKKDLFAQAAQVLRQAIQDSIFPGAQVAVISRDELTWSQGFGRHTYDPSSPGVTPQTIYDLASVTKVAATTIVAMYLWQKGKLLLDRPVNSYIPEFKGEGKDAVTIRNLLTHTAGLKPFTDLWNKAADKSAALRYVYSMPLIYSPNDTMVYSDLGLIMLASILESVGGASLDRLANEIFYGPLCMQSTMFNPPEAIRDRIAPTEIGGNMFWRGLIWGEVHDENAFFLGGVAGHAGLFSTAEDLAILARMLISGGTYSGQQFFSPATIKSWTACQNLPRGSERALGWDTPSDKGSSAGDYFSPGSFGHLGFTGTSLWIDPNRRIAIILLTNRVHPTRVRGGMYKVRRDFHNAVMRAF